MTVEARPQPWPRIEVWRQADGFWRWRYRNQADGTLLVSNESHVDRDHAARAAALAYPGVPMVAARRPRVVRAVVRSAARGAAGGIVAALVAVLSSFTARVLISAVRLGRMVARSSRRRR